MVWIGVKRMALSFENGETWNRNMEYLLIILYMHIIPESFIRFKIQI